MSKPRPTRRLDSESSCDHKNNARVAANTKLEVVRRPAMVVDRRPAINYQAMKEPFDGPANKRSHGQMPKGRKLVSNR